MKEKKKTNKGVALLTTVLFLFTLSVMGATFLMLTQFDLIDFDAQKAEAEAQYVSEAGIHKAMWYLNNFTYGTSYLSVKRTESIAPERQNDTYTILPVTALTNPFPLTATGKIASVTVKTSVLVNQDMPGTPELDYTVVNGSWKHTFVKEP